MAEINLGNENEINVNISTDTNIGATVPDINYIPGYQIAEEERRANEVIRQSNEADRISLYEDMENKLATGYFDGVGLNYDWEGTSLGVKREDESEYSYTDLKGDTGNDGVSPSASVTRGTGSATITVTDASGTTTAVIYDGEKGEKGDKGDPGEVNIIVVEELPATGVEDTIYLVPLAEPDVQGNNYAEYIYINGAWELLGKVGIATDLTDYVKNTDYASLSKAGVVKTNSYSGFNVSNGGGALCDSVTYSQYEGRINDSFISKGTLENVITGKGLVSSSSLSTVATTGSYNDLLNKPTIPDELADLTDDSTHRLVTDTDKTNWNNKVDSNGNATTTSENTSFNLTNTLEAPLEIDLKGNTIQTGTPTPSSPIPVNVVSGDNDIIVCGKNILNILDQTKKISGVDITVQNGTILFDGTWSGGGNWVVLNTDFTLSEGTYKTSYIIRDGAGNPNNLSGLRLAGFYNSYTNTWNDGYTYSSSDLTFTVTKPIHVTQIRGWTNGLGTVNNITYKSQLEKGSTATTYEAYNGTTYNIDLPVENLIDDSLKASAVNNVYIGTGSTSLEMPFKAGTYTISTNVSAYLQYLDTTTHSSSTETTQWTFTLENDTNIRIRIQKIGLVASDVEWVQVEKGSKANTYTPYGTTPIELNKIGTYQDYIYKENDKWYLHKEIGKVVLDGTEDGWLKSGSTTQTNFVGALNGTNMTNIFDIPVVDNSIIKSNRFTNTTSAGTTAGFVFYNVSNNKYTSFALSISASLANDITAFKNWLDSNNTSIYYPLATPTNTEITYTPLIEQLNTLEQAQSYEGTTNINQVNNDLPFIINATVFNDNYNGRYRSLKYMYDKLKETIE